MFFIHEIKKTDQGYEKGIVVKETVEEAKQVYHAYLGAYAYGKDVNTTFVDCMITEENSNLILLHEQWSRTENE